MSPYGMSPMMNGYGMNSMMGGMNGGMSLYGMGMNPHMNGMNQGMYMNPGMGGMNGGYMNQFNSLYHPSMASTFSSPLGGYQVPGCTPAQIQSLGLMDPAFSPYSSQLNISSGNQACLPYLLSYMRMRSMRRRLRMMESMDDDYYNQCRPSLTSRLFGGYGGSRGGLFGRGRGRCDYGQQMQMQQMQQQLMMLQQQQQQHMQQQQMQQMRPPPPMARSRFSNRRF